jgi:PAS domain S-box-containing protein
MEYKEKHEGHCSEIFENSLDDFSQKNNFRIKEYFDSIFSAIAITTSERAVIFVNSEFTHLLGLTLQDVSGKTLDSILDPQKVKLNSDSVLKLETDYLNESVYKVQSRTGKRIYVSYMMQELNSANNLAGYIVMFHDITVQIKKYSLLVHCNGGILDYHIYLVTQTEGDVDEM